MPVRPVTPVVPPEGESVPGNPVRPKVRAAGQTTGGAVVVAYVLRLVGVHVNDVPPEVLIAAAGGLATLASYLRRDGLRGAWERVVDGDRAR